MRYDELCAHIFWSDGENRNRSDIYEQGEEKSGLNRDIQAAIDSMRYRHEAEVIEDVRRLLTFDTSLLKLRQKGALSPRTAPVVLTPQTLRKLAELLTGELVKTGPKPQDDEDRALAHVFAIKMREKLNQGHKRKGLTNLIDDECFPTISPDRMKKVRSEYKEYITRLVNQ